MTMIKDVLDIQRSYSTQVELRSEYYDLERREERMTHYKPIKAHRVAFEKIVEGLYRQKDKRSYILSGSFGTGKSHLLMMAASYFSSPSSTPEMKKFFDNYELAEQEEDIKEKKAAQLRNLRSEGEFLVSICDYASPDFETNLLRALRDTLEKKEIDPNTLESEYLQAYGKIQAWSDSEDVFFIERLEKLLDAEGEKWSISSLQSALSDFDVDALDTFKKLYKKVTSTDFQYDKDNYVEVISQMVKSPQIRDKYKGWVILFDEFDYQVGEKRFHLGQFQRFLAMCSESLMNGFPIMFIAAIHKSFLDYKSVYNSNDFTTISDRLDEIKLESEGVEDIISAVVNPKKDSDIWKNEIAPKASEVVKLANETNTHHLFDWLKAAQIKSKIIENIYPMHPAATYALIKLAGAAGSNNRSVVTFFADEREERGSYAYFINHTEVEQGGMLNLYTVDALCDYFDLESSSENITDVAKEYIRNYETSLRELARIRHTEMDNLILSDNLFERVLKVMVIYDVIGLANTPELIRFGLNMTTSSRAGSLDNVLKLACEKKIIYLNDTNGCYEFKRSDSKDISGLIRDYKSKPENLPDNYISALESVLKYDFSIKSKKKLKGEPLSPQKYNLLYREDKRLKKVFCMLKDIEDSSYFDDIHNELEAENDHKKNFDGAIVYVICEKNDEIDKATSLTKNNKYKEIMVAVCNEVAEIYDDIFSLVAACHCEDNSSDFSSQDLRALKEQAQTYDTKIAKRLDFIMDSKNYKAYGAFGEMLENGANDVGAAALLENIFKKKRNAFSHDDLNKSHEYKENNIALRDAVDMLLEVSQKMSYHMDYGQDRGDIKYIKNVLIQNGVLYSTNTNGSIAYCEIELDIEKYKTVIPALHDMIKEVHDRENEDINIQKFVQKYRKEYGLGNNSLLLFMAVLRKYYSDALSIVKDVTAVGSISVNNMEMLKAVLLDPAYSNCIMKYESISEEEEEYIQKLMEIFGGNGKNANLESLHQLMSGWYASLDSICKASDIYCEDATKKFVGICNRMETTPIRELVLYDMKDIIGIERDDLIHGSIIEKLINEVTKQKEIVANGYSLVRKRVIAGLATLFGNPTENIEELKTSFFEWSAGLDEAQKDVLNQLQNDDSKPIAKAISLDLPFATVILESIPTDMHFGAVKTWTSDQVDDYINAFKRGKTHIENNVYSVSCPKYTAKGIGVEESENGRDRIIKFSGEVDILIDLGEDNVCFYITTDGTNPTDSDAQREKRISSYIMKITSDTNIRLCGVSESGKYSSVLNLQCRNEETKYEVKVVPVQQRLKLDGSGGVETSNDIKLDAIVPIDSVSLCLCVKSIAELMKSSHDVTTDEIISGLKKAIEELGE
jgi:hypothetical protein